MLRLSDFYFGSYKPHPDSVVVGVRVDEYIVEPYGQEAYDINRLFVGTAVRESAFVSSFPCGTVFVVKEKPLLVCHDFGPGKYNTNMDLFRVWVEAAADSSGDCSLMAENQQGQRFLLTRFPRDTVYVVKENLM